MYTTAELSVALSLPWLRFSSHRGEFAATTFGKDEVLPRANGPIVLSGTVDNTHFKFCFDFIVILLLLSVRLFWYPIAIHFSPWTRRES